MHAFSLYLVSLYYFLLELVKAYTVTSQLTEYLSVLLVWYKHYQLDEIIPLLFLLCPEQDLMQKMNLVDHVQHLNFPYP